jgi:hypothetical protein
MGRGFSCSGKQGGTRKASRRGGMLGLPYFETGIRCDTGQRESCPSLALRPKLPATADQWEVARTARCAEIV